MSQLGRLTEEIRSLGAGIVAIAVTAIFSQQRFARELGVDFPLLSDWNGDACTSYGVRYDVWKGHKGLAKRSVFVVDPVGVIRYRWVTDDANEVPDFGPAIDVLRTLGAPSAHPPRATPPPDDDTDIPKTVDDI
ncbi:MAG: redoxin domain-containing protein [Streptosporangiales bacterium]|nr:redoxin domain-containing protein [Streptosporangiales bacterium]